MHEGLIDRLKAEPRLDKVYFDKNGGWLFVPNTFHTVIKTREEVIAEFEESLLAQAEQSEEGTLGGIVAEIVDTIIPPTDAEGKPAKKDKDAKKK
jgi:hypothetical protein